MSNIKFEVYDLDGSCIGAEEWGSDHIPRIGEKVFLESFINGNMYKVIDVVNVFELRSRLVRVKLVSVDEENAELW